MKKYILIFILTLLSSCSKEELEIKIPIKSKSEILIRESNEKITKTKKKIRRKKKIKNGETLKKSHHIEYIQ